MPGSATFEITHTHTNEYFSTKPFVVGTQKNMFKLMGKKINTILGKIILIWTYVLASH